MQISLSKKHGLNPSLEICFFCGEAKGVLLFGANKGKEAPKKSITDYEPCECCKEKFKQGFLLIEASTTAIYENEISIKAEGGQKVYPTGNYWLLKEESAKEVFGEIVKLNGKAFINKEDAQLLGLYDKEDIVN